MKRFTKLFACLSAVILLMVAGLFVGCSSSVYSEEQHLERVKERAEERFLGEDSEYTGLEVYPLYNEYDKLKYVLVELEPQGFMYVRINDKEYPWRGMYTMSSLEPEFWIPYQMKEGAREDVFDADGNLIYQTTDREYYRDENGQVFVYHQSHFKVAGIENERRYLLAFISTLHGGHTRMLMPAVKRGEQYLNLVDGKLMDYEPEIESATYASVDFAFIGKSAFDL